MSLARGCVDGRLWLIFSYGWEVIKPLPCLPNKQRPRQAQPCPHHNKQTDAMKKKGLQPLPHSAAPPAGFFHLKKVCVKILKKKLSSKMIYFWISQMSHASKHPCHALHSAKMFFGPIMETTMKHAGFDPNYLAGFEKNSSKVVGHHLQGIMKSIWLKNTSKCRYYRY